MPVSILLGVNKVLDKNSNVCYSTCMNISIYQLLASDTKEIFYIGKTNNPVRRLNEHVNESKRFRGRAPKKEQAVRDILSRNAEVIMNVIANCSDDWREVEKFHITSHQSNCTLTNVIDA